MLPALFLLLLSQPVGDRWHDRIRPQPTAPYAAFEFAPSNGSGMGTVCACTTPTGAKGEVMTFSRASSGTCLKTVGTAPQAIANGDMVTCSSGQPRVMPGPDGTSVLGLLVEGSRTNLALHSQDFPDVSWANFIAGSGTNPTKGGADSDVAPDGTTSAEKVTFNATGASDSSGLSQTILTAAAYSLGGFARGNATTSSGSFDLCMDNASTQTCTTCAYVLGSWTYCKLENVTSKASGKIYVGNLSSLNGGTTRPGQTPTLWGFQAEAGGNASSYIVTTTVSVTRSAELANIAISFGAGTTTYSVAATSLIPNASLATYRVHGTLGSSSASTSCNGGGIDDSYNGPPFVAEANLSSVTTYNTGVSVSSGSMRAATYHDGSHFNGCVNGTCGAGTASTYTPPAFLCWRAGTYDATNGYIFGVTKLACLDPSPTRCR